MGAIWNKSGEIARDNNDVRAIGALAYFFLGGTTTPYTVYANAGESTAHLHPVEADGNGRWPFVSIPFTTSYDVQVTTEGGTQLYYHTSIPNANPVTASEDTVEDEELVQTGHCWFELVDETKVGAVRLNGRTMGNAASGATERANADTVDLYTYLYNKLANGQAAISGGRGASAAADYAANKTITLPDLRSALPRGLDDMGNSAASLLGSATFGHGDAVTPGSLAGANTHALTEGQLAAHTHADGTLAAASSGAHTHSVSDTRTYTFRNNSTSAGSTTNTGTAASTSVGSGFTGEVQVAGGSISATSDGAHTHDVTGATSSSGSDTAHNNVSRCLLGTWYIKL